MKFLIREIDWVISQPVILLIKLYQWILSPFIGMHCRFKPTCSNYMLEAIKKYGTIPGVWKGILRICKCHPGHPGGYDPP